LDYASWQEELDLLAVRISAACKVLHKRGALTAARVMPYVMPVQEQITVSALVVECVVVLKIVCVAVCVVVLKVMFVWLCV
jgi:hypothetical protein